MLSIGIDTFLHISMLCQSRIMDPLIDVPDDHRCSPWSGSVRTGRASMIDCPQRSTRDRSTTTISNASESSATTSRDRSS